MEEDSVVALPRPGASVTEDPLLAVPQEGAGRMLMQAIEALGARALLALGGSRRPSHLDGTPLPPGPHADRRS